MSTRGGLELGDDDNASREWLVGLFGSPAPSSSTRPIATTASCSSSHELDGRLSHRARRGARRDRAGWPGELEVPWISARAVEASPVRATGNVTLPLDFAHDDPPRLLVALTELRALVPGARLRDRRQPRPDRLGPARRALRAERGVPRRTRCSRPASVALSARAMRTSSGRRSPSSTRSRSRGGARGAAHDPQRIRHEVGAGGRARAARAERAGAARERARRAVERAEAARPMVAGYRECARPRCTGTPDHGRAIEVLLDEQPRLRAPAQCDLAARARAEDDAR